MRHGIFVASRGVFRCGTWTLWLWRAGSVVTACRLGYSVACGILVPRPGIKPVPPALQGGFLIMDHQGGPRLGLNEATCFWPELSTVFPSQPEREFWFSFLPEITAIKACMQTSAKPFCMFSVFIHNHCPPTLSTSCGIHASRRPALLGRHMFGICPFYIRVNGHICY